MRSVLWDRESNTSPFRLFFIYTLQCVGFIFFNPSILNYLEFFFYSFASLIRVFDKQKKKYLVQYIYSLCSFLFLLFWLSRLSIHIFNLKYLSLCNSKNYNDYILIKYIFIKTNLTRPHMTIFLIICWKWFRKFSPIMNSVKILSRKKRNKGSNTFSLLILLFPSHILVYTSI